MLVSHDDLDVIMELTQAGGKQLRVQPLLSSRARIR